MTSLRCQIQKLQYELQKKMNLADDHIQGNTNYLNELQAMIVETSEKIKKVDYQIEQRKQIAIGKDKRQKANHNMQIAILKAKYEASIRELEQTNQNEIDALNQDFQSTLQQIQKIAPKKVQDKIQPLEIEIRKVQDLISKKNDETHRVEQLIEPESENDLEERHEMEFERIRKIEQRLQDKDQERLNSLLQCRQQLYECVHTLEEMEQTHNVTMDNFKDQLAEMDEKYVQDIKTETDNHKKEAAQIKQKIREVQQLLKSLTKSYHRTERNHKDQFSYLSTQTQGLEQQLMTIRKQEAMQRAGDDEIGQASSKFHSLRKELIERERILGQMRSDNELMKREIARINHEMKISKRREVLQID